MALLLLCMAMRRSATGPNRRQPIPPLRRRRRWRVAGMLVLTVSLGLCAGRFGLGAGLMCWFCLMSAIGLVLIFSLPYRERWQQALLRRG